MLPFLPAGRPQAEHSNPRAAIGDTAAHTRRSMRPNTNHRGSRCEWVGSGATTRPVISAKRDRLMPCLRMFVASFESSNSINGLNCRYNQSACLLRIRSVGVPVDSWGAPSALGPRRGRTQIPGASNEARLCDDTGRARIELDESRQPWDQRNPEAPAGGRDRRRWKARRDRCSGRDRLPEVGEAAWHGFNCGAVMRASQATLNRRVICLNLRPMVTPISRYLVRGTVRASA